MSASQLTMFEPMGDDLARLAVKYAAEAERARSVSSNYAFAGFTASATFFARAADAAERDSFQSEMALQFEQLAGLS